MGSMSLLAFSSYSDVIISVLLKLLTLLVIPTIILWKQVLINSFSLKFDIFLWVREVSLILKAQHVFIVSVVVDLFKLPPLCVI